LKKIIPFLILLVLTLAAFNVVTEPNAKADASEVVVVTYSQYVAPSTSTLAVAHGDLIVVGEVRNMGVNVIGNVTVQGTALSANGYVLAVTSSQAFAYYMLPDQKAPFYLDFTAQSSSTQDLTWVPHVCQVLVIVTSVKDAIMSQYADLKVSNDINYIDNSGLYVVRGTVVNTGSQTVQAPWVVTTFYDASGTVIGLNFTNYLVSSLIPKIGSIPFFATPADNNSQLTSRITGYSFQVDSLTLTTPSATNTPSPTPTPPTPTPTPTTNSLTTASPTTLSIPSTTPLPTISQKPSGSPGFYFSVVGIVAIVAVAGIVVIAIVAFAVLVLLKKHNREVKPI
jgi:hypothetical protein